MKITKIYNTVYAFATQRNATQRNATQRNAYHNYILNNNFKFYIYQFFRAFNFLSVFVRFAKNQFANLITMGFNPLLPFATAHNGLANGTQKRKPHCYKKWIATPSLRSARNDNFNYAFSCALKNKFEIISQLDYGFCYKNYFFNLNQVFRNSYDFGERFGRNLNYDFEKNYNGGFGKNNFGNCNFGFDFGNEICGIGNNLAGFLFNRKIKKNKFMSAF